MNTDTINDCKIFFNFMLQSKLLENKKALKVNLYAVINC